MRRGRISELREELAAAEAMISALSETIGGATSVLLGFDRLDSGMIRAAAEQMAAAVDRRRALLAEIKRIEG
jgi:uncharacterized protein YukE